MPGNIEEFLNPKSMPTPAAAGAIVALISGALFKNFGLSVAIGTITLSFLVGLIVLQSREFRSDTMSRLAKFLFYSINSLIIFAMATGTTSVMANEILIQERPFFYDWTKHSDEDPSDHLSGDTQNYDFFVEVAPTKDKGIMKFLKANGVITKEYATRVTVIPKDGAINQEIESVILTLPDDSFENAEVNLTADQVDEGVSIRAWKSFRIEANVTTTTGDSFKVEKFINPEKLMQSTVEN